jgi:MFS family permease
VLKAQSEGLALALIPLVFVLMNFVYAATATPAGILSDKGGREKLLLCGLGVLLSQISHWPLSPGFGASSSALASGVSI